MAAEKYALAPRTQKRIKLVPPDGGWGWMIIIGTAVSNIFNQSMLSMFSFLYGDALEAMGYSTQGAAVVTSTMTFVTNFGGPVAGVLQKFTSARCVCVLGACLSTLGIFCSGFSTNIVHLTLSYGVSLGLGLGLIQNASFVAMNAYFKLKKSRAVGLAMVGTGVGQSLMPHLVRYLLEHYDFRGACLILSGLSLNGIAGCLLLQPVEWHMKKVEEDVPIDETMHLLDQKHKYIVKRKDSVTNSEVTHNGGRRSTDPSILNDINGSTRKFISQTHLNQASNGKSEKDVPANGNNNNISADIPKKQTFWDKMYILFDISLLSNWRFLNVIFGTSICVISIQNFSMLYPLFLRKAVELDKQDTATCMSAVAIADICGRLFLPMVQDKFQIKARWMLIYTSVWILVIRQILAYQTDLLVLLAMSSLYGVGRSMIIVARNIAISEIVRLDQVPAAVGLGMLTTSIIVLPAYYILGWIRDYTGSYIICITAQNVLMIILLVMWLPDMFMIWREEKREKKGKDIEEVHLS